MISELACGLVLGRSDGRLMQDLTWSAVPRWERDAVPVCRSAQGLTPNQASHHIVARLFAAKRNVRRRFAFIFPGRLFPWVPSGGRCDGLRCWGSLTIKRARDGLHTSVRTSQAKMIRFRDLGWIDMLRFQTALCGDLHRGQDINEI